MKSSTLLLIFGALAAMYFLNQSNTADGNKTPTDKGQDDTPQDAGTGGGTPSDRQPAGGSGSGGPNSPADNSGPGSNSNNALDNRVTVSGPHHY